MVRTRSGVGRGQPPVEARGQGQAPRRGKSRGWGRPREVREGGQPHRELSFASSSAPRAEEEGSPFHEHEHEHEHETSSIAPVSAQPAQAQVQAPIPGLQELIGVISQAVATAVASVPSSQIPREDHEKNYERARKLGAVGFKGTTDPLEAENWFQQIEKIFTLMKSSDEQKLSIATFLLEGRA